MANILTDLQFSRKQKVKSGIYMHFKGGKYEVFSTAVNRDSGDEIVLYRRLGNNNRHWEYEMLEEFTSNIKTPDYEGPRFWIYMSNDEGFK